MTEWQLTVLIEILKPCFWVSIGFLLAIWPVIFIAEWLQNRQSAKTRRLIAEAQEAARRAAPEFQRYLRNQEWQAMQQRRIEQEQTQNKAAKRCHSNGNRPSKKRRRKNARV